MFTPRDFLGLAARAAVDQALSLLAKAGHLRRLARGLYDFPKLHPKLGAFTPAPDDMAQALARAANALGLSTLVAAQSSWLTDGPTRRVVLGKRVIDLRHSSPKHLIASGSPAGTVVKALRHVGASHAAEVLRVAVRNHSDSDKKILAESTPPEGFPEAWR